MTESKDHGRMLQAGALCVLVAVSLAIMVLPGKDPWQARVTWLAFPWGVLALALGTAWMTRDARREGVAGRWLHSGAGGLLLLFIVCAVVALMS